jgi:hypothetical protein
LKGGVESMLMHYCPEVKSVEEVVSTDIEEVRCILNQFFLFLKLDTGQQFSAQIC